jgi:predicted AlkP superfamily phosphohydrolase/phosphomutase
MKIVVLGFDGVEPTLLDRLIDEGKLPGFNDLRKEGIYSQLDSSVIPISAMAWNSFATGVNPGKHGVYDFVTRSGADSTEFDLTTSRNRQAPTMWDYFNTVDRRVGIVGMPVTYPVDDFDGFMISGYPTPAREHSFWPPELEDTSPVDPGEIHANVHFDGTNRSEFIDDQFRQFDAIERFHHHALDEMEWDLLVTVFKQTDDIAHVAWDDPELHDIYQRADQVLRETRERLKAMDEKFLLLVLSDHGFGPVDKTLFLNNVLRDLGFLKLKRGSGTRVRDLLCKSGINMLNSYRLMSALGLGERLMSVGFEDESAKARLLYGLRNAALLGSHDIDMDRSACFSRGNYGQIFVEDESDTEALVRGLMEYTVDGNPIIADVHRASNHFHGDATDIAPDLMIETPDYRYLTARGFAFATDRVLTDHIIGRDAEHKQKGVFFATGSGIDCRDELREPSLEDVLPTLMYALGEDIPTYLDGEVLDIFSGEIDPSFRDFDLETRRNQETMSSGEREELRSQLESLGYAN